MSEFRLSRIQNACWIVLSELEGRVGSVEQKSGGRNLRRGMWGIKRSESRVAKAYMNMRDDIVQECSW